MLSYGDPPEQYRPPTKVDQCAEWLRQTLEEAGKPMKPADVVKLGEQAGFSRSTIYKARGLLGDAIRDTELGQHPRKMWKVV